MLQQGHLVATILKLKLAKFWKGDSQHGCTSNQFTFWQKKSIPTLPNMASQNLMFCWLTQFWEPMYSHVFCDLHSSNMHHLHLVITLQNSYKPKNVTYTIIQYPIWPFLPHGDGYLIFFLCETCLEIFEQFTACDWCTLPIWLILCLYTLSTSSKALPRLPRWGSKFHWPVYSIKVGMFVLCIDCFLSTRFQNLKLGADPAGCRTKNVFLKPSRGSKPKVQGNTTFYPHDLPILNTEAHPWTLWVKLHVS